VQFRREVPVDPHVAAEVAVAKFCKVQSVVQDWPEHSIGVSVVVFLVVVFDKVGEYVCLMPALDRLERWSRGSLTTPTKPDTGMPL
jgi:hypothetical protein